MRHYGIKNAPPRQVATCGEFHTHYATVLLLAILVHSCRLENATLWQAKTQPYLEFIRAAQLLKKPWMLWSLSASAIPIFRCCSRTIMEQKTSPSRRARKPRKAPLRAQHLEPSLAVCWAGSPESERWRFRESAR